MAEQIFNSLVPADSASFSAIIAGMALHGQFESAYKKYKEAKEAQMDISIDAYNHLIAGTPFLKESHEKRWEFIEVRCTLDIYIGDAVCKIFKFVMITISV